MIGIQVGTLAMESCLIPYELPKRDDFYVWLEPILRRFPSPAEAELHDNFYVQRYVLPFGHLFAALIMIPVKKLKRKMGH